jgi:hypothetical protein
MPEIYDRVEQWDHFSEQVARHIVEYTLPQYGNPGGNEQVDAFSERDIQQNLFRYVNRMGVGVRGPVERLRDLLKIAHYASFAYDKLRAELGMEDVYPYEPGDRGRGGEAAA